MKWIILLLIFSSYTIALYPQFPVQPISILDAECDSIGNTYFDKQTYATMQNRIYCFDDGLLINTRETKGTGNWIESICLGPVSHEDLVYPSMVTGGENHNSIYLLSLTRPYINGGSPYKGLDGALVYSRSTDGGETWDILNQVLPGMDSSEYSGFTRDSYTFAEPKGNIVAFVTGSFQHDLFFNEVY